MKKINKFKEETRYTLEKRDNGYYYGGFLNLRCTSITSLPDNLTVGGFLDLRCTSITSLPDNLTIGGSLYLHGISITSLPDNLTVGGSLNLRCTSITSLPDNLTVGGSLDLRCTSITSLPDNLTVGGSLNLRCTSITSLPDNLTVGGFLDLDETAITNASNINRNTPQVFFWRNKSYVKADGVFSKVISHRGNVYRTQQIGSSKLNYLVNDGNKWSHGSSFKDAKEDLLYKISNRDTSKYDSLTLESKLSFKKAIEAYRVITGACSFGTKDFVLNRLENKKSEYSVSEIIELTKNEYGGSSFENFFNK